VDPKVLPTNRLTNFLKNKLDADGRKHFGSLWFFKGVCSNNHLQFSDQESEKISPYFLTPPTKFFNSLEIPLYWDMSSMI